MSLKKKNMYLSCCRPDKGPPITNGNRATHLLCRETRMQQATVSSIRQLLIHIKRCTGAQYGLKWWPPREQLLWKSSDFCQELLKSPCFHGEINSIHVFLKVSAAGVSPAKWGLRFHLKYTSNTTCVGGLHLQLTFWKAVTCWQRKQRVDTAMAKVQLLAKGTQHDGLLWILVTSSLWARMTPADANQTEELQRLTPPAQGSA